MKNISDKMKRGGKVYDEKNQGDMYLYGCGHSAVVGVHQTWYSRRKTRHKNIYTKEECQKPYDNVIEKCVGAKGTPYKAYDRLQTWISIGYQDARYSSDEWVDSEGNIKLPFDKEELFKNCEGGRMFFAYYVPDDVAAKASTKELVDICLDYFDQDTTFWEFDFTAANEIEWLLKDNNALEETLRRDDLQQLIMINIWNWITLIIYRKKKILTNIGSARVNTVCLPWRNVYWLCRRRVTVFRTNREPIL